MSLINNIRKSFISVNIVTLVLLLLLAGGAAALFVAGYTIVPLFIIAGLIGLLVIYICFAHPLLGFFITTVLSFFVAYPERILRTQFPLSTGIEVLTLLLFIGSYKVKTGDESKLYKTPISVAFLLYVLFVIIEFFNPNMHSIGGWIFYVRRLLMFILIYILAYRLLTDMAKIRYFLKLWCVFAFITAAYGCFQQWFGMLPFEMDYLMSNPHEYKLYFQGGTIRKFSFLSDPTTFGIMAGSSSVFVLILAINEKIKRKRNLYFFVFFILAIGMTFSGTRTANVMLPAGLALYALLTITNKVTITTIFIATFGILFLLFGPIQNKNINRIRSTFNKKEESASVRDENRKYIQPYIYAHPIGGGIATSGVLGEKYNPRHVLAGFPPDSGLLQAAIELGWIGYALTILVYFLILYQCIHYFFLPNSEKNKILLSAIAVSIFSIIVTQYSQVAIGQLPTALFFYAVLGLTVRIKEIGKAESEHKI